jgi:exonuclease III
MAPENRQKYLISDKVDFKLILIKRDKKGHSILIKGEIKQKEITIINLYVPNVSATNFIKHTLKDLKAHIDSNTVVVRDLVPLYLQHIGHPNKKVNQEILELNNTIDQMDLADAYRIFHPTSVQYTFFSAAHRTFSSIGHILWHKQTSAICKKIEYYHTFYLITMH